MPKLINLLILVTISCLASIVVAEEQVVLGSDLPAVQVTPHQQNSLFQAQNVSPIENTTPALLETSQPEDLDPPGSATEPSSWLVTSPYTTQAHLTNLTTLSVPSRLLTLALTHLTSTNTSYATTPYHQALNWPTVFTQLRTLSTFHNHTWITTTFYVVEFRSRLKADIDRELLFKLDRESHREATASGGLLKYWFGKTSDDAEGRNLATCLWVRKEDAVAGGKGPWHKKARAVIPQMYESIQVTGLKLTVDDDVSDWRFEPWVEVS